MMPELRAVGDAAIGVALGKVFKVAGKIVAEKLLKRPDLGNYVGAGLGLAAAVVGTKYMPRYADKFITGGAVAIVDVVEEELKKRGFLKYEVEETLPEEIEVFEETGGVYEVPEEELIEIV